MHHRLGDGVVILGLRGQRLDGLTVRRATDLHHRMNEQVDGELEAVHGHAHGIHQERHVIAHHLDNRVRGLPAVGVLARVVDPDLHFVALTVVQEVPVGQGGSVKIRRSEGAQILVGDAREVLAEELGHRRAAFARHAIAQHRQDVVADLLSLCAQFSHEWSPSLCLSNGRPPSHDGLDRGCRTPALPFARLRAGGNSFPDDEHRLPGVA